MKKPPVLAHAVARSLVPFRGSRAAQLVPHARLAGPMPWVIAIMVALTTIAAAGGLALSNLAETARGELSGAATVQIVEPLKSERDRQARAAEAALARLPEVSSIRVVPDRELDALLEPWLGSEGEGTDAVPVPALIDVELRGPANDARLAAIRGALAGPAPAARVDAQSAWLAPVFAAIRSLQFLALALVVLLAFTSSAAVLLAARSALGGNRGTIEIVHLLGGTDAQIARIFQRSVAFDAAAGGVVGLALGMAAIFVLGRQFSALDSGMVAGGGLGPVDWLLIATIPLAGVGIAMLTARLTVLGALRKML
ncbi:cell division protein [Tsuneonella sp. YG55]|uniref:Cell division protein n=1 Tax=Tsuneonella litorea TaxID=2976475 RepID=A0A9X2W4K6_9SPHN|nr:cell division protein [Tsuneonella litorea]MCT2559945.1 cell division protein [Tsuneonella litorea]